MKEQIYFFAGGGTGGHIYPALGVAQKLKKIQPKSKIHFFCSDREVDSAILSKSEFEFTALPAVGLCAKNLISQKFALNFHKSMRIAMKAITSAQNAKIIGVGGFVAGPVVVAAKLQRCPIGFINVDIIPGKANRLMASLAKEVYVQFNQTTQFFKAGKAITTGCPLREEFENPDPAPATEKFDLDPNKKTLLITGASSGAANINRAMESLLGNLEDFSADWQILHLTGREKNATVATAYKNSKIHAQAIDYYDQMQELLAVADIVIGRSGAVSVAEYICAATPAICLPYPYHKDRHQYLNAQILTQAGAAVIVDDNYKDPDLTTKNLWNSLEPLLSNQAKRADMSRAAKNIATPQAATNIAQRIVNL